MKLIIKVLFILLILTVISIGNLYGRSAESLGTTVFLEPSFTQSIGGNATINNKKNSVSQSDINLAFGYMGESFFMKVVGIYSYFNIANQSSREFFDGNGIGVGLGWDFGNVFRIWDTYIPNFTMTSKADGGTYKGFGERVGISFPFDEGFYVYIDSKYFKFKEYTTASGQMTKLKGDLEIVIMSLAVGITYRFEL